MKGELVSVVTNDKVKLDGFYAMPESNTTDAPDAAILLHGLSGNFYQSRLLKHFANSLLEKGIATLLVNTRGHDYLNLTAKMGRSVTLGAAVEIIDECKYDVFAWTEFLTSIGKRNVMLLGHSLGAIKALYSQAHMPHDNVKYIAAYSATKLSYDSLLESSGGDRFAHWLNEAQKLVADDRGDQFLFVDFPFPTWMSASAYLAKYGDGDRNNWLSFADRIKVPVLAAFGQREMEENPAFHAMKPDLENLSYSNYNVKFIPDADHFYSACFDEATTCLSIWLDSTLSVD